MTRDSQNLVRNDKSQREFATLQKAIKMGLIDPDSVRRPINHKSEETGDFITFDKTRTYEMKSILSRNNESLSTSLNNVIDNITDKVKSGLNGPTNYIIDLGEVPNFLQDAYIKEIKETLTRNQVIDKIELDFTLNKN